MHEESFEIAKKFTIDILKKTRQLTIEAASGGTAMSVQQYNQDMASLIAEQKNQIENYQGIEAR